MTSTTILTRRDDAAPLNYIHAIDFESNLCIWTRILIVSSKISMNIYSDMYVIFYPDRAHESQRRIVSKICYVQSRVNERRTIFDHREIG